MTGSNASLRDRQLTAIVSAFGSRVTFTAAGELLIDLECYSDFLGPDTCDREPAEVVEMIMFALDPRRIALVGGQLVHLEIN